MFFLTNERQMELRKVYSRVFDLLQERLDEYMSQSNEEKLRTHDWQDLLPLTPCCAQLFRTMVYSIRSHKSLIASSRAISTVARVWRRHTSTKCLRRHPGEAWEATELMLSLTGRGQEYNSCSRLAHALLGPGGFSDEYEIAKSYLFTMARLNHAIARDEYEDEKLKYVLQGIGSVVLHITAYLCPNLAETGSRTQHPVCGRILDALLRRGIVNACISTIDVIFCARQRWSSKKVQEWQFVLLRITLACFQFLIKGCKKFFSYSWLASMLRRNYFGVALLEDEDGDFVEEKTSEEIEQFWTGVFPFFLTRWKVLDFTRSEVIYTLFLHQKHSDNAYGVFREWFLKRLCIQRLLQRGQQIAPICCFNVRSVIYPPPKTNFAFFTSSQGAEATKAMRSSHAAEVAERSTIAQLIARERIGETIRDRASSWRRKSVRLDVQKRCHAPTQPSSGLCTLSHLDKKLLRASALLLISHRFDGVLSSADGDPPHHRMIHVDFYSTPEDFRTRSGSVFQVRRFHPAFGEIGYQMWLNALRRVQYSNTDTVLVSIGYRDEDKERNGNQARTYHMPIHVNWDHLKERRLFYAVNYMTTKYMEMMGKATPVKEHWAAIFGERILNSVSDPALELLNSPESREEVERRARSKTSGI